ncbi:MAG: hypothetical protein E7350_03685 [Clostridiales bacterium]|nr:hypothetical protein [Clostridiales bacterium]
MKRLVLFVFAIAFAYAILGCNNPEITKNEGTAYGITNGACPVKVTMTVDGDGKILEAHIYEYLSVYDMGALDTDEQAYYSYGVQIDNAVDGYAKHVRVGQKVFEYCEGTYICNQFEGEDKSFDSYVSTATGGEWYIACVKEGDFDIIREDGSGYGVPFDEYDGCGLKKNEWADKLKNGWHDGKNYESSYKENIYKISTHLRNHGFYGYDGTDNLSDEGTHKVGKYDTLVDMENFHDYMKIAQKAYSAASN